MKRLIVVLLSVLFLSTSLPALAADTSAAVAQQTVININAASAEQLQALPGIGQVTAGRIIAYRDQNGPFSAVDQLVQVKGIGAKTLEKIRDRLVLN